MDYQEQQRALPFSIENILRKDFPPPSHLSKRPTQFQAASEKFTKGQTSWPLFSCCSVCYYLESRSLRASSSRLPGNFPRRRESTAVSEEQLPLFIKVPFKLEVKRTPAPEVKRVSAPPLPAVLQEKTSTETGPIGSNKGEKESTDVAARKKRFRSHFSQRQLQYLESVFSRQQYLSRDERALLANALEMTELQIRNWFQNRRYQKRHREVVAMQRAKQVPVRVLVRE